MTPLDQETELPTANSLASIAAPQSDQGAARLVADLIMHYTPDID